MKLDLIVPHYKEPWSLCKYLFDSIAMQRGINFDDLRVLVVNDGDECLPGLDFSLDYPYEILWFVKEHGGVSAARNYGIRRSDADYVMFCDCDDGFLNNWGLHLVFKEMKEEFDLLVASFVEEVWLSVDQYLTLLNHENDPTFVHGKVYRRDFLLENNLFFDEDLVIHEDGYFNQLVYTEAMNHGRLRTVKSPIYIWKYNDKSVVRRDKKHFVLRTYEDVMKARIRLCRQLKQRGFDRDYNTAVCVTILDSFYDFQKPAYLDPANAEMIRKAEQAFKEFWNEFKSEFFNCENKFIAEVARGVREKAFDDGFLYEQFSLQTWLKHIEFEV